MCKVFVQNFYNSQSVPQKFPNMYNTNYAHAVTHVFINCPLHLY